MFFENIEQVLNKKVTRKEFLVITGTIFLALFGISGFLNRLSEATRKISYQENLTNQLHTSPVKNIGYGNGVYGGAKTITS